MTSWLMVISNLVISVVPYKPVYQESRKEKKSTLPVDIRRAKKILTSAGMSTNMISVV